MKLKAILAATMLLLPTAALAAPGIVTTSTGLRAGPGAGFPLVDRIPGGARVADSTVHSSGQKYFALPVGQIIFRSSPRPVPDERGASRSSRFVGAGCDGRRDVEKTNDMTADGEVVWS